MNQPEEPSAAEAQQDGGNSLPPPPEMNEVVEAAPDLSGASQQDLPGAKSAEELAAEEDAKEAALEEAELAKSRLKLIGNKVLYYNALKDGKVEALAAQITEVNFEKETVDLFVLHKDKPFVKQDVKISASPLAGHCSPPQEK